MRVDMSKSEVFVPRHEWQEFFDGWHATDVVVRSAKRVTILTRQTHPVEHASELWDHDVETRAVQLQIDKSPSEKRCYRAAHVEGFNRPALGTCTYPLTQELIVARNEKGSVYAAGSGLSGMEYISPDGLAPIPMRLVTIGGYAYSVGLVRQIYKRVAVGHWERFNTDGLPQPPVSHDQRRRMGFVDMDGPNEQLLYAVGGRGDVFRFDGSRWHVCDFPSNEQLATVTVSSDGDVYITGEGGNLWVGAKDLWRLLEPGSSSVLYNDSRWFQNQLWLSSDYHMRVLQNGKLRRPTYGNQDIPFSGHMDARDDLLVVAGLTRVDAFDGNQWQCLVAPYK